MPPSFFSVVIELRGGLVLSAPQLRLIERLYSGASYVAVSKLHGGFSGSLVLHVVRITACNEPHIPCRSMSM